jgi:hypothetical protein
MGATTGNDVIFHYIDVAAHRQGKSESAVNDETRAEGTTAVAPGSAS